MPCCGAAGSTTALIGTIEYRLAGVVSKAVNTTPESLDLFELFARLEKAGGTHATMETSSHALALGRVYGIQFHTAVFTNLTRDHLDFHNTMEEYFAAKQLLFTGERRGRTEVRGDQPRRCLWAGPASGPGDGGALVWVGRWRHGAGEKYFVRFRGLAL